MKMFKWFLKNSEMNKKRRKQKPNKYAQTGKFSALDEYVEKLKSGGAVFHCFLLILLHTQRWASSHKKNNKFAVEIHAFGVFGEQRICFLNENEVQIDEYQRYGRNEAATVIDFSIQPNSEVNELLNNRSEKKSIWFQST